MSGLGWSLGSCANLVGIQERTEGGAGAPGLVDDETQIETSELCIEYCDTVMSNCEDDFAVYANRAACVETCNVLPPGPDREPIGNTVQCRLKQAKVAADEPAPQCPLAGPGGGDPVDGCGGNCASWCQLGLAICPDQFEGLQDCEAVCESIPDTGDFNLDANYTTDTVQCRIIHLMAALDDPTTHCPHTQLLSTNFCDGDGGGEVSCDSYCTLAMASCTAEDAVYESFEQCQAVCAVLPPGEASDQSQNTVGCRSYHASVAAELPGVHCDHAGPGGDGVCGSSSDVSGNCESYCLLLEQGCPSSFVWADQTECTSQCESDFEGAGAAADSKYSIELATSGTAELQCRTLQVARALEAGDEAACDKALAGTDCP